MILTQKQTEEKLGVGTGRLLTMIKDGLISPSNQMPEGATKFFRKFDSVAVNKLLADMKANGSHVKKQTKEIQIKENQIKETESVSKGIVHLLSEINEKLDKLIKIWA